MSVSSRNNVEIHPTALVHEKAVLGEGSRVGAFSIVGEDVVLGPRCTVQEHVVLRGLVRFGEGCSVFPFAVVGAEPQHTRYKGEPTRVEIGNRVTIRESVTIHRGTAFGGGVTRVGDDTYLMAYVHVAHDCLVGSRVYIANGTQLAGHVEIHDNVILGGMTAVPQFLRIGRYCYIGGHSALRKDVPPFLLGKGDPFEPQGINAVGLTRQGFSTATVQRLRKLYRIIFLRTSTLPQAMEHAHRELGDCDEVRMFLDFVRSSKQGIVR